MDKEHFIPDGIPSPPDPRNFTPDMVGRAANLSTLQTFPISLSNRYPLPIENQGNIGACGAFSGSEERCITEKDQTGKVQRFSAGYIYTDRFGLYTGEGMIPLDLLKGLQKYGAVPYDDFPYIDRYDVLKELLWGTDGSTRDKLREKAKPYRISSYYRIDTETSTPEDIEIGIKNALMNGWKVLTFFDVYSSFWDIGKDGIVPIPNINKEKNYGGHIMLTTGWTEDNLTDTQNHWNGTWGDNGYAHFPFNYPFRELWAITDNVDRWEVELMSMYADADKISAWAKESVARATELGLINGDGTNFNPQGLLSREQAAALLIRLYDKVHAEINN